MRAKWNCITVLAAAILAGCSTVQQTAATPASDATPDPSPVPGPSRVDFLFATPVTGVFTPDTTGLNAIRPQFPDASLQELEEGYALYTKGACTACHQPYSIYTLPAEHIQQIVGDMAQRAEINDPQKSAVYRYMLSMKATQPR